MTTLLEELRADQDPRSHCKFCVWLAERPPAERKEWAAAMADRSFTHTSIFRAAQRRGFKGGSGSVEGHRKNGHE